MLPVASLIVVVTLSILVTRIATVALSHTGLSREAARFQARSAFTGAGFTTNESESVVNHPVRRRIVLMLMLVGNAGIVTAVSSLILTFVSEDEGALPTFWKAALLVTSLLALWAVASSQFVDKHLNRLIDRALKRYTRLEVRDYAGLMQLEGGYRLVEMLVEDDDWVAGKTLLESELRDEGIIVLGVRRADGDYIGAPNGDTRIEAADVLTLYGRGESLEQLDNRRQSMTAEARHDRAVAEQKRLEEEEAARVRAEAAEEDAP